MPQSLSLLPFVTLILLIALGPLYFEKFWHKSYTYLSVSLGFIVICYYVFGLHHTHHCIHAGMEYISFISILAALFFASGGIIISTDEHGTPAANAILLLIGAILASTIGTTGAAMILIRPFIHLNKNRLAAYQKVFFIFIVCNAGGLLTPIGDPPLFIGFIKGIPFFWIFLKALPFWLLSNGLLIGLFYYIDKTKNPIQFDNSPGILNLNIKGLKNIVFLCISLLVVFLDPNIAGMEWLPSIHLDGMKLSFVRETILLLMCYLSFKYTDKALLKKNDFTIAPIKEVAYVFFGLFLTMMPVVEWIEHLVKKPEMGHLVNQNTLFWLTGCLSAILDNAPTYLNSLTAALGVEGLDINSRNEVLQFLASPAFVHVVAISVSSVLFGAFSYLGNAPNLMVKAIAEQKGVKMPSFFEYIIKYSIPILLPIVFLNWLLLLLLY